ncbi:uncharacterized protein LOC124543871 [Vanessa cardui]|uniref:uncharacterized protein LOC124543871 n=1 Tax=Vanessa cardui TaxID=171605 RepID=UPI001F13A016|nr:uncharacterized protein LOC124543871 [Vanessa cardui]
MTPVHIIPENPIPEPDNCLPEPRAVVTPKPQSVNEIIPQIVDGHHQANDQSGVPTLTMNDLISSPSTSSRSYLSPKMLQPIPRLTKTVSNRERKGTKPTILTSSPYKRDLETSIQKNLTKNTPKRAQKKTPKKMLKKTVQKKRKISKERKSSSSSSYNSDYLVNLYYTDESPDHSQNGKCLYCNGLFSEDVMGEKWIQCASCKQRAHEDCAGIEDMVDFYVCELCNSD